MSVGRNACIMFKIVRQRDTALASNGQSTTNLELLPLQHGEKSDPDDRKDLGDERFVQDHVGENDPEYQIRDDVAVELRG